MIVVALKDSDFFTYKGFLEFYIAFNLYLYSANFLSYSYFFFCIAFLYSSALSSYFANKFKQ